MGLWTVNEHRIGGMADGFAKMPSLEINSRRENFGVSNKLKVGLEDLEDIFRWKCIPIMNEFYCVFLVVVVVGIFLILKTKIKM